jgi:hypothetical protein
MGDLTGYLSGGANGIGGGGNSLLSNFAPTVEQLEKTPGYQFTRDQGLKATQNSMAAKGLGVSGNAIKAGADYAENLAQTTWMQQLQAYLQQQMQAYNMLSGTAQIGANAAGQAGDLTGKGMGAIGSQYGNIGNALAGGTMGQANAYASGVNALGGGLGGAAMLYGAYNNPLANTNPAFQTAR